MKMKRVFILPLILLIPWGSIFAFEILSYPPPVEGGDFQIDIGVGFTPVSGSMRIPPLAVNVEYALPVKAPVSVGGLFALYQSHISYVSHDEKLTYMTFGARGNWHWAFPVKWLDFYTGLFLGYSYVLWDAPADAAYVNYSRPAIGAQAGAHFYFTEKIGAVVEAGYPFAIKAGLALKF